MKSENDYDFASALHCLLSRVRWISLPVSHNLTRRFILISIFHTCRYILDGPFHLFFETKPFYAFLFRVMHSTFPVLLILLFAEDYRLWISSLCDFNQLSITNFSAPQSHKTSVLKIIVCLKRLMPVYALDLLISMVKKISVFWDITPCSPAKIGRHFGEIYCFHRQGQIVIKAINHRYEGKTQLCVCVCVCRAREYKSSLHETYVLRSGYLTASVV
jgi:hypothetical protein